MDLNKISNYIFLNSKIEKADLAIVFGTQNQLCISAVKEIYSKKLVKKFILSGGKNRHSGEIEAKFLQKELLKSNIPNEVLILEKESKNTLENVLFSKKLIDEKIGLNNVKKIIAVVKHFHSRRAIMTLKKHFPKHIKILPFVYPVGNFTKENWFDTENGRRRVFEEWEKIPIYLAKGDIQELEKDKKYRPKVFGKMTSFKELLHYQKNNMAYN